MKTISPSPYKLIDPTNSRYRFLKFKSNSSYSRFKKNGDDITESSLESIEYDIPAHGTYNYLLFKPEWRARRLEIIERDKGKCVICSQEEKLQVHHRQYHFVVIENKFKMPWEYADNLLITLCETCHKRGHNKFKVPTINI